MKKKNSDVKKPEEPLVEQFEEKKPLHLIMRLGGAAAIQRPMVVVDTEEDEIFQDAFRQMELNAKKIRELREAIRLNQQSQESVRTRLTGYYRSVPEPRPMFLGTQQRKMESMNPRATTSFEVGQEIKRREEEPLSQEAKDFYTAREQALIAEMRDLEFQLYQEQEKNVWD